MAYLYRHIRLDKNEPFYIGISGKNDNFKRAYSIKDRNDIWRKIVAKTDYEVEIILDELSKDIIKQKEKEFIEMYGRIDLQTGILSNLTDGGDGVLNMNENSQLRHKLSLAAIGKKMSKSAKKKMSDNQKLPILQFDLNGIFIKEWDGIIDATKSVGKHSTNIMRCCQGKFKQAYGFIWKYKNAELKGRKLSKQNEELSNRLNKAGL
jgi:hypothetical protein